MTEKICISCGTESPSHFEYCKHCGAILPVVDKIPHEEFFEAELPSFEEISYDEYSHFVGINSKNILEDFKTIEEKRYVFCLPVLFLGLFFGFFGMSAWFFYRKLKKQGCILFLIGTLLAAVHIIINVEVCKAIWFVFEALLQGSIDLNWSITLLTSFSRYTLNITRYIEFAAAFFVSAFALRMYKKASYKKISVLKGKSANDPEFPLESALKNQGGTSVFSFALTFISAVLVLAAVFAVVVLW